MKNLPIPVKLGFIGGAGCVVGTIIGVITEDYNYIPIMMFCFLLVGAAVFAVVSERKSIKKKKLEAAKKQAEKDTLDTEKLDKLINYVKRITAVNAYKIKAERTDSATVFDSKFGGVPYWTSQKEYPRNSKGKSLTLLAQLNFTQMNLNDDRLPDGGILQIFADDEDELVGCDFSFSSVQDNYRIVYHKEIDMTVTEQNARDAGARINTEYNGDDFMFPFDVVYKLDFVPFTDYVNSAEDAFEEAFEEALAIFGEHLVDERVWKTFNDTEYNYITEALDVCWGHKMLGHPNYTQNDVRGTHGKYDTLLLQIDSEDDIMWGDSGVANFFISAEDLKHGDFSDVLYNWDCY